MGPCYCGVLIATRRGQPHTTDDGLSSVLPLIPANQLLVSQELKTKERENRWQSRQPIRRLISAIRPPKRTRPACHSSVTRGKWINGNLNVGMWDADRMRCISIQPPTSTRICMHNDIQHLHSNHAGYRYFIMHSVAGDFSFLQLRRVHKKKKKKKKRNTSERGYNRVRPLPIVVFIPDANLPGFFGLLAAPTREGGRERKTWTLDWFSSDPQDRCVQLVVFIVIYLSFVAFFFMDDI